MLPSLRDFPVLALVADGFSQTDLETLRRALTGRGADFQVVCAGGEAKALIGIDSGETLLSCRPLDSLRADEFQALVLPGGPLSADALRNDARALALVRDFQSQRKPILAVGHAVWILASAGLVSGRRISTPLSIQDDLRNAGAVCVEASSAQDANWLTLGQSDAWLPFLRSALTLLERAWSAPPSPQVPQSA
jgi:protease I